MKFSYPACHPAASAAGSVALGDQGSIQGGAQADCFVPIDATKQRRDGMKPFFASREGMAKPVMVTKRQAKRQAKWPSRWGPS
jgi:hypothetical protein